MHADAQPHATGATTARVAPVGPLLLWLLLLGGSASLPTTARARPAPRDRALSSKIKTKTRTAAKPAKERKEKPRRNIAVALARYHFFGAATLLPTAGQGTVALTSQFVRAKVQLGHFFRKTGTVLAGAVGYDHAQLGHALETGGYGHTPVHHLSVRLVLGQRLVRRWMLTAFVRPGVASDFHGFDGGDVRVSAGALARFAYRPHLSFGFGVLYNNGVFGHLALPILNVEYRSRLGRVRIRFPHQFQVWWTPHRAVEIGLDLRVVSGLFRLHADSVLGDAASLLYITAGPVVRHIFLGGLFTQLSGGYAARYLQLYRDDRRTHRTLDFRGWYLSATLGYLI